MGDAAVSLVGLVNLLFQAFYVLLLLRVILSWVPGIDRGHPAVRFVDRATAPVLAPLRRILPPAGGLDLSPMVAILLLVLAQRIVVDLLVMTLSY